MRGSARTRRSSMPRERTSSSSRTARATCISGRSPSRAESRSRSRAASTRSCPCSGSAAGRTCS
jgi:hypothetical protein